MTQEGMAVGTPMYMAPEQVRGIPDSIGPRTDIYALGAMLYEVISGWPPHTSGTLTEMFRKILTEEPRKPQGPRDLTIICMKALQKDPLRRYETATEFADDLDRFLRGEPISARPPSMLYRLRKALSKRRTLAAVTVSMVIIAVLAGVWVIPGWLRALREKERREAELTEEQKRREALERARPYIDEGARFLAEVLAKQREPDYLRSDREDLADKAIAAYESALTECPGHPEALLGIGRAHMLARRMNDALATFGRCIEADPDFAPPYLERARTRLELSVAGLSSRQPDREVLEARRQIESDLRKFGELAREAADLQYGKALLAYHDGRFEEACDLFQAYLQRKAGDGLAHFWHGCSLAALHRWKDAERAFDSAVTWDTRFSGAWCLRGRQKERMDDQEGAIADYSRAIEISPFLVLARVRRADLLMNKEELDAALEDLDVVLRTDPDHAEAHYHRATIRQIRGDYDGAQSDLDQVIRVQPGNGSAYYNRAFLHLRQGRTTEAISDFTRAIEIAPGNLNALLSRADAYLKRGDLKEACADFERCLELAPADWPSRERIEQYVEEIKRRLSDG